MDLVAFYIGFQAEGFGVDVTSCIESLLSHPPPCKTVYPIDESGLAKHAWAGGLGGVKDGGVKDPDNQTTR